MLRIINKMKKSTSRSSHKKTHDFYIMAKGTNNSKQVLLFSMRLEALMTARRDQLVSDDQFRVEIQHL